MSLAEVTAMEKRQYDEKMTDFCGYVHTLNDRHAVRFTEVTERKRMAIPSKIKARSLCTKVLYLIYCVYTHLLV